MIKASLQDICPYLFQVKCPRHDVAALLHQYINQVAEVIRQIIEEYVFQAV